MGLRKRWIAGLAIAGVVTVGGIAVVTAVNMSTQNDSICCVLPPASIESVVAAAPIVIIGHTVGGTDDYAEVLVTRIVKGNPVNAQPGDTVRIDGANANIMMEQENYGNKWSKDSNDSAYFVNDTDPLTIMTSASSGLEDSYYSTHDTQSVERILAGLSATEPTPTLEEIDALADRSDAIVFASVWSDDGVTARVKTGEVFKGTPPSEFDATHGLAPDTPGGPWQFYKNGLDNPTGESEVLFLQQTPSGWEVINPSPPYLYRSNDVLDHLRAESYARP